MSAWEVAMKRALVGVAALLALPACTPPATQPDKVAWSCVVERRFVFDTGPPFEDQTSRILWIDLKRGLYAVSEFGSTEIDLDWALAMAEARAANAGLAPVARQSAGFVCLAAGEDHLCRHGVDLARGAYAFDAAAIGQNADGGAPQGPETAARVTGVGECRPASDVSWPAL